VKPLIVTGYTPAYEEAAMILQMQAVTFGDDILLVPYEDRGSWMRNIRAKADCLMSATRLFDRPVMWVDADSTMCRSVPEDDWSWFSEHYDFAGPLVRYKRPRKYYVGCLFFNNTTVGAALLRRWWNLCERDTDEVGESDEHWLEYARQELEGIVRWGDLPIKYAWLPKDGEPTEETVFRMGLSGNASKHAPPVKEIRL